MHDHRRGTERHMKLPRVGRLIKPVLLLLVLAALGTGGWMYYVRRNTTDVTVNTSAVTRGDVVDTVGATGALQAVTTVQVGSQVSGNIQELGADFNTIVKKGQ